MLFLLSVPKIYALLCENLFPGQFTTVEIEVEKDERLKINAFFNETKSVHGSSMQLYCAVRDKHNLLHADLGIGRKIEGITVFDQAGFYEIYVQNYSKTKSSVAIVISTQKEVEKDHMTDYIESLLIIRMQGAEYANSISYILEKNDTIISNVESLYGYCVFNGVFLCIIALIAQIASRKHYKTMFDTR